MASGLLPGNDHPVGRGNDSGRVQAKDLRELPSNGARTMTPERGTPHANRSSARSDSPTASPSRTSAKPTDTPSKRPSRTTRGAGTIAPTRPSTSSAPATTPGPSDPVRSTKPTGAETSAESEVLSLVNRERSQAGCSPVTADPELAALAGAFSKDMADRGFFDHTDPDGNDPWDRAEKRGISNLGGENIARGQPDAKSVMDSWMQSSGHRANILNCDFRTLGVGAHFADGDHWWTQDFGF